MAALIKHAFLSNSFLRTALSLENTLTGAVPIFFRGKKKIAPVKKVSLESTRVSLSAKGFLRNYKEYSPPSDLFERLDCICEEVGISKVNDTPFDNEIQRFDFLVRCEEEFKHSVPNSMLCNIQTIGDLREFYDTPVNASVPLDALKSMELPENLHVQYEYHRFHPDTDTMFGGKTAFPQSSTLVTGLKYKKKYPGHSQKLILNKYVN